MSQDDLVKIGMESGFPELVGKGRFTTSTQELLVLETDVIMDLLYGEDETEDGLFTFVAKIHKGNWRWGSYWQLIIKDFAGNFWGLQFEDTSGDEYWNSLSDFTEHKFYPVKRLEQTTYAYERI